MSGENSITDYQIAHAIIVARHRLRYCKVIAEFPGKNGMQNFDTNNDLDSFYKNICNACFCESLLIVASLLSGDKRIISFKNWKDYYRARKNNLDIIDNLYDSSGLKKVRNQVVGHIDSGNSNNRFLLSRTGAYVDILLINKLDEILDKLISEFYDFTSSIGKPYSADYFSVSDAESQINKAISTARPILTSNYII